MLASYVNLLTSSLNMSSAQPPSVLHQGRPLAWQEGLMALATLFQKFDFIAGDPSYVLQLKQTITLKPKDFTFYAIPRKGAPSFSVATAVSQPTTGATPGKDVVNQAAEGGKPLYVFYGSNTGSCESFAQDVASGAVSRGASNSTHSHQT